MHVRGELTQLKKGIANGRVKIGFAGGSITTAKTTSNWPLYLRGWFVNRYQNVRLSMVNAAIGATGSMCGLAISQKEFIDRNCDLVFMEYAVNDNGADAEERMRTQEGLIRKLLSANIDVVLIYTFYQEMLADMGQNQTPKSIRDMELLAGHYNISSVFVGRAVYEQVEKGLLPWNVWLPDGTHPQHIGSYFYAASVIAFLEEEMKGKKGLPLWKGADMPKPLNNRNWQYTEEIPFSAVKTVGSWTQAREVHNPWFEEQLFTYGMHDALSIQFEGRGLAIIFSYGKTSGVVEYRLDGGGWQKYSCQRYWWMPEENFVNAVKFADDLPYGKHLFELRVAHECIEGCTSCDCKILMILAVQ